MLYSEIHKCFVHRCLSFVYVDIASRNKVLKDVFNLPSRLWIEIIEQGVNKNFYANSNKLLPKPKFLLEAYMKRPKNEFRECF